MKKLFSIAMAVCFIFAMISCDTGNTGSDDNTVTISYNANGWTTSTDIPKAKTGTKGKAIGADALPALDDSATQRYLGWSLTSGQNGARVLATDILTGNITLYVLWQQLVEAGQEVTISYDANGWTGGGLPQATTGTSGDGIGADNIPDLEDTETQVFLGWAITPGQTGAKVAANTVLRGNTTLYVLWTSPVILSFDYNFETDEEVPEQVQVGKGAAIGDVLPVVAADPLTEEATIRSGYSFVGWFTTAEGGTKVTAASVFETSVTLYAQWIDVPNWVWFDLDLTMLQTSQGTPGNQWPAALATATNNPDGSLSLTFNDNNQRALFLLTPGQQAVMETAAITSVRLVIDGESDGTTAANQFRYFIGHPDLGTNWNGTTGNGGNVAFETILDQTVTFNDNRFRREVGADPDPTTDSDANYRTKALILQHRVAGAITLTIRKISIRYDGDIGPPPPAAAFRVSFDLNYDGAPAAPNGIILEAGDAIGTLPVVTRYLYTFSGWYDAATNGAKVEETTTFTSEATLYAQWEKKPFVTITYDLNYGGDPEPEAPAPVEREIGDPIGAANLPVVTRTDYKFLGWYTTPVMENGVQVTATSVYGTDQTIYAQWGPPDADTPVITTQPGTASVGQNATLALSVEATITDEGILSYQWYSAATSSGTGTEVGTNSKNHTVDTSTLGVTYYYVIVTNTNNEVNGTKIMTVTSNRVAVEVVASASLVWEEKIKTTLTGVPVYGFILPPGKIWGNYDRIVFKLKIDDESEDKSARLRAWGNYPLTSSLDSEGKLSVGMGNANVDAAGSAGNKLLNANTYTDYSTATDYTEYEIVLATFNALPTDAAVKQVNGLIAIAFGLIPNNASPGNAGSRTYYVKDIVLSNTAKDDQIPALRPDSALLWGGTGTNAHVSQDTGNFATRELQ